MSTEPTSGTSTWTGWASFASVIILVNGIVTLMQGLVVLLGPQAAYVVVDGSIFLFSRTGWGWWTIGVGTLLTVTAIALFSGAAWARILAVILAVISAAGQVLLLPAQPWWSIVVIAIDVLIIYALTVRGHELGQRRKPTGERGAVI